MHDPLADLSHVTEDLDKLGHALALRLEEAGAEGGGVRALKVLSQLLFGRNGDYWEVPPLRGFGLGLRG